MDEFLELGTEYRYHLIDDLPGKVVGAFIQDPRRLCLTSKGIMNRELESVALNFKRHLRQHLNNLPVHKSGIKDSLDVESPCYITGAKELWKILQA